MLNLLGKIKVKKTLVGGLVIINKCAFLYFKFTINSVWIVKTIHVYNLVIEFFLLYFNITDPSRFDSAVFKSKFSHILKNLIIIPKAVYISNMILEYKISHLHVHWGSSTATAGLIASKISGVKWSFTCHRWDIYENNLLKLKIINYVFLNLKKA